MMIHFTAVIKQFGQQGEKTGWSYIELPAKLAETLYPGQKKSFRVKGKLDEYAIKQQSVLPMGDGNFIMALKATVRKAIRKQKGATIDVSLEVDKSEIKVPAELKESLAIEPSILERFNALPKSHRNYFINWINAAKTDPTKAKRIAAMMKAIDKGWNFGEMLRAMKKENLENEW
jgi:hypothetical protein